MKKINIITTSLATITPLLSVVSCSKWNGWKKSTSDSHEVYEFEKHEFGQENEFAIREYKNPNPGIDNDKYLDSAINKTTTSGITNIDVDLTKLNNNFELIELIVQSANIKSPNNIGDFWEYDKWQDMANYLKGIHKDINFNFKYNGNSSNLKFTPEKTINSITDSLEAEILKNDETKAEHAFDIKKDLKILNYVTDKTGLLSIPAVNSLKTLDANFALTLQNLVYLPNKALDGFEEFLNNLDLLIDDIYNDPTINQWLQTKRLTVNASGIVDESLANKSVQEILKNQEWKGMFLIQAFRK